MRVRQWPQRFDHRLTADTVGGRYRLDRLIGRGGAADVHEGLDLRLRRPVAIKVFRPGGDEGAEERFTDEAVLLARVQHPGLVTVYDSGRQEGNPYLVMQLVKGSTLRHRIAAAPLVPAETCRLGAALSSALAHVHDAGVVHRDVKPANILLDRTGRPYLADFGISRLMDHSVHTATGTLLGTAAYLAPEQVKGQGAGPAADVYALGLVLLESLKGELEYDGALLEAAVARMYRPPVLPPGLPAELADLLRVMTALEEEARPSAHACAEALTALALELGPGAPVPDAGAAVLPEPGTDGPATLREARAVPAPPAARHRRNRVPATAGAVLAAVLGAVTLTGSVGSTTADSGHPRTGPSHDLADGAAPAGTPPAPSPSATPSSFPAPAPPAGSPAPVEPRPADSPPAPPSGADAIVARTPASPAAPSAPGAGTGHEPPRQADRDRTRDSSQDKPRHGAPRKDKQKKQKKQGKGKHR